MLQVGEAAKRSRDSQAASQAASQPKAKSSAHDFGAAPAAGDDSSEDDDDEFNPQSQVHGQNQAVSYAYSLHSEKQPQLSPRHSDSDSTYQSATQSTSCVL